VAQYSGVYSFSRIWELVDGLINRNFPQELKTYKSAFSDDLISAELLVSIFWEETLFQNIGQDPTGPAMGFGQVEEGTRKNVLAYFNNESLDGKSLGSPRIPAG
jgi:hypothetical protein